jgi:hypothetical protein
MPFEVTDRRRYLFALAGRYHLTREERLSLTEMVLRKDVRSWSELTETDMRRLVDTLEGHALVQHLLETRSPT